MKLQAVDVKTLRPEIFRVLGAQSALLAAGDRDKCNTMTIGWGQMGEVWSRPVCTVYVRPERYTYQFMESKDYFSVCVLPAGAKKTAAVCGSKSGREVNKIEACGLTLAYGAGDTPYFEEAELVLVCRKLYAQDLDAACVSGAGREVVLPFYGEKGGWHRVYMGEVVEAYQA